VLLLCRGDFGPFFKHVRHLHGTLHRLYSKLEQEGAVKEGEQPRVPTVPSSGNVEAIPVAMQRSPGNQQGGQFVSWEFLDVRFSEFFTVV
jgi:hypothetical protein